MAYMNDERIINIFDVLHQVAESKDFGSDRGQNAYGFALHSSIGIRDAIAFILSDCYTILDETDELSISSIEIAKENLCVAFQYMDVDTKKKSFIRYEFTSNYSNQSIGMRVVYVSPNRTSIDIVNTRIYQRAITDDYLLYVDGLDKTGFVSPDIPEEYLDFTRFCNMLKIRFRRFSEGLPFDHAYRIGNRPMIELYDYTQFRVGK